MNLTLNHIAFHLMRKLVQEHTACWQNALPELTKPQYSVLRAIASNPGIEQVELTGASVTTKATLAEMLGRMEKRDWIYREAGETDKRRRFVYLTEAGDALLANANPVAKQVDDIFLKRLSDGEQTEFVRLLNKMMDSE